MHPITALESHLRVGDVVFTRIGSPPFRQIAEATCTWTNHVGIVVGFNCFGAIVAESWVQFCSRFVREVLQESTGEVIGEAQTFRELLERNRATHLRLWNLWYFGRIPWDRVTITPGSLYTSGALQVVFDGTITPGL